MNRATTLLGMLLTVGAATSAYAPSANAQTHADYVREWDAGWQSYQQLEAVPLDQRGYVSQSQTLTIEIDAPIAAVYDIYSNVDNALGRHPFLTEIDPVRRYLGRDFAIVYDFIARESIPLPDGTIFPGSTISQQRFHPLQFTYDTNTYDFPGIVTHQHVVFTRLGFRRTQVTEYLTFEATPEFIQTAVQGGVVAHQLVQQALKRDIESGALQPSWRDLSWGCNPSDEGRD
jgi:hypothetical protein